MELVNHFNKVQTSEAAKRQIVGLEMKLAAVDSDIINALLIHCITT